MAWTGALSAKSIPSQQLLTLRAASGLVLHAVLGAQVLSSLDLPTAASARPSLAFDSRSVSMRQLASKPQLLWPRHFVIFPTAHCFGQKPGAEYDSVLHCRCPTRLAIMKMEALFPRWQIVCPHTFDESSAAQSVCLLERASLTHGSFIKENIACTSH